MLDRNSDSEVVIVPSWFLDIHGYSICESGGWRWAPPAPPRTLMVLLIHWISVSMILLGRGRMWNCHGFRYELFHVVSNVIWLEGRTLPENNISPLKIDGWKTAFLLGWPIFMGELLALGSVTYTADPALQSPFDLTVIAGWNRDRKLKFQFLSPLPLSSNPQRPRFFSPYRSCRSPCIRVKWILGEIRVGQIRHRRSSESGFIILSFYMENRCLKWTYMYEMPLKCLRATISLGLGLQWQRSLDKLFLSFCGGGPIW